MDEKFTQSLFDVFFFQAEDGIRDWSVTGVQTCALPIYFNLMSLWPLLLENDGGPRQNAAIFGHALVEHFSQQSDVEMLHRRFYQRLDKLIAE